MQTTKNKPKKTCKKCKGKGEVSRIVKIIDGYNGFLFLPDASLYGFIKDACPICNGTGK